MNPASWLDGEVAAAGGPVAVERMCETHTSWVFLDADRAYKVRKPVDLGFLDYTTEAARRQASLTEYELGRRISPHLYRGVWALDGGRLLAEAPSGDTGEPVLVMDRLPDELRADAVMADTGEPVERLDSAVSQCARFHQAAPVDTRPDGWGALENTAEAWDINFEQMPTDDASLRLAPDERAKLISETTAWLEKLAPVLKKRIEDGRIREGHGDLRLEHVYLTEPWSAIDPLEFSRKLRYCDVAAEICFLAMELDESGRADAADHVLASYAELTEDTTLLAVAPFFKRYRAVVRGKVEWIRGTQIEGTARDEHFARSRRLFELALRYAM